MKFNGEIWVKIPVTQKQKGEPDEFVIVKNVKSAGGLIPYARYGEDWTTTVPNRPLIRELILALKKKDRLAEIIETVIEQGCVKLKSGEEGIPRQIEITPEYITVDVDTDAGHFDSEIDDIEEIIFTG